MKQYILKPIWFEGKKYKKGDIVNIPNNLLKMFKGARAIRGVKSIDSDKPISETETKIYTEKELERLEWYKLKRIGKEEFGTTDRSRDKLIEEILKIQEDR